MYQTMFERDEEKKKKLEETFKTDTLPKFVTNMESLLERRGGKHFAGNEVRICKLERFIKGSGKD